MRRIDRAVERAEQRLFDGLLVRPWWHSGKAGWRWRLIMAYRALQGHELGGFRDDEEEVTSVFRIGEPWTRAR